MIIKISAWDYEIVWIIFKNVFKLLSNDIPIHRLF